MGKRFCTDDCREKFHARAKGEGAAAIKLVKAWVGTRHAPPGTREAEICRTARRELTQLAEVLIQRDRVNGRAPASDYIAALGEGGSMVTDRVRL